MPHEQPEVKMCECEHVGHFDKPLCEIHEYGEKRLVARVKTDWGHFNLCRDCLVEHHGANPVITDKYIFSQETTSDA